MSDVYVTDELIHGGTRLQRGAKVSDLSDDQCELLLDSGQVSTSKPRDQVEPAASADEPVTLASFSDEEILAEATERGLIDAGQVDYAELKVGELKKLAAERELEVSRGDGKDGDPVQADYVAALEKADAEQASSDE